MTWLALAATGNSTTDLVGGANLLQLFVLALGGALVVGNGLALMRPPRRTRDGRLVRPPVGRSVAMMVVGLVAAVWAIATLTS